MPADRHFPVIVGLTLCEDVVQDPGTGNVSLIRCFTGRGIESFPAISPPFCVFATVVDGLGDFELELAVEYLGPQPIDADETVIHVVHGPLRIADPLQPVRIVLRLTACEFPVAGIYQFTLLLEKEWLAHTTLRVYSRENVHE